MKDSKKKYFYAFPITLWLTLFFMIPMLIVLSYAFLKKGTYGGVEFSFSMAAFSIFQDKVFLTVLWKTIYISMWITALTVFFSIPVAYYIAPSSLSSK